MYLVESLTDWEIPLQHKESKVEQKMLQTARSGASLDVDGSSTAPGSVTEHVRKKARTAKDSQAKDPSRRRRIGKGSRTISELSPEERLAFAQRFKPSSADDRSQRLSRAVDSTPETTDEEEGSTKVKNFYGSIH